jgi:hypothetical protein
MLEHLTSTFIIRPARNALKPVCGKFKRLIYKSMITPTQRTMHGRRVFAFSEFLFRSNWPLQRPEAALIPCMKLLGMTNED